MGVAQEFLNLKKKHVERQHNTTTSSLAAQRERVKKLNVLP